MNVWFSSDWHFNHENILKFTSDYTGEHLRPEFSSVEEMDEAMIDRHNTVVRPFDKFYCLGDVGFGKERLATILPRLNGKKRLILGNHDQYEMTFYERYFQKIMVSWRPLRSLIFSHFPLHIGEDDKKLLANVHGHVHKNTLNDKRYLNLSVETINYTPIHYDQIIEIYKDRGIEL